MEPSVFTIQVMTLANEGGSRKALNTAEPSNLQLQAAQPRICGQKGLTITDVITANIIISFAAEQKRSQRTLLRDKKVDGKQGLAR